MVDKVLWAIGHDAENRPKSGTKKRASRPRPIPSSGRDVTIEDHIARGESHIQDLFRDIQFRVFALDRKIVEKAHSNIAYAVNGRNFIEMWIQRRRLKILLRPKEYNDPKGVISRVPETHGWTLDRQLYIESLSDIDYALDLIRQSYDDVVVR